MRPALNHSRCGLRLLRWSAAFLAWRIGLLFTPEILAAATHALLQPISAKLMIKMAAARCIPSPRD
jgi:hypothetical protein